MSRHDAARSGWSLIPRPAVILAIVAFVLVPFGLHAAFVHNHEHGSLIFTFGFCVVIGIVEAGYILLAGYVYGDAKRRGMNAIPWTVVAVVIPNLIGFLLYFLLRKAIRHLHFERQSSSAAGRDAPPALVLASDGAPAPG